MSSAATARTAVGVDGLVIATTDGAKRVIADVTFDLAAGEVLGIVGESGSGKTTLGLALLRHCRAGLRIDAGRIVVGDVDLRAQSPAALRRLRGHLVCYVPQDPTTALNPAMRIRAQLAECLRAEDRSDAALLRLLEEVRLPMRTEFLDAFPHQLSGGQLQRVAIAMAFANRPRLVVMDEPTTGLDVTTQAHVLRTVRHLSQHHGVAVVYVSHDIAVVASIADRVAVVYSGRIVEIGPTPRVLGEPQHPYTRALIRAVPDLDRDAIPSGIPGRAPDRGAEPDRCSFAPRCELAAPACRRDVPPMVSVADGHDVRCLRLGEREAAAQPYVPDAAAAGEPGPIILSAVQLEAFYGNAKVLHDINFEIRAGECVGLVGESGSGKTTLARALAGLHPQVDGFMAFKGEPLLAGARNRERVMRQRIQYIFQNAFGSLNPYRTIGASIAVALNHFGADLPGTTRHKVLAVLDQVSLPPSIAERFPRELSGGQRQRAAIARALVAEPDLLICDEITSALDVSVQAVIIEVLARLQRERGLTILFVTHNLAVVRSFAQRIIVMRAGSIVENGATGQVLSRPLSDEGQRLLADAPRFLSLPGPETGVAAC